ncbi:MAG TPA: thiosulfate sulfurtransferase PspE [Buttiauxella sp.]|uniref:thiosulfate sulfurtransferase PspE n=1 Tax=Buttiauxella sp. TaxID=1972222 RepID=UPI002B495999|nr:thiosulfate sulfurtransferase PspE [Buttiauxella sp.]HKM96239.1 thiosulfate sulfurtransferase PspE [Buttiauxella sp.]
MFGQTRLVKKALLASALLLASNSLWAAEHWIDVRAPEQYKETHVEGAVNIPLEQIGQRIQEVSQDKNDTLHLYCNTGNKSGKAETLLKEMGYKNVVNDGGLKNVEKTQIMVKQ